MIPQINQQVRLILRNNSVIDGIVQQWSERKIILTSLHDNSTMIIMNGEADVLLTKIIDQTIKPKEVSQSQLAEKLKETIQIPNEEQELKQKSLQELKLLKKQQEKKIINEQIREHTVLISNPIKKYNYPSFFNKKE